MVDDVFFGDVLNLFDLLILSVKVVLMHVNFIPESGDLFSKVFIFFFKICQNRFLICLEHFICEFVVLKLLLDIKQEIVDLADQEVVAFLGTLHHESVTNDIDVLSLSAVHNITELLLSSQVVEEWFIQILHQDRVDKLLLGVGATDLEVAHYTRVFI